MQKIAIPVADGKLSAHFGHAPMFYIFDIEQNKVVKEQMELSPAHEHGVIPRWLCSTIGISAIIAGGMGQGAVEIFNKNGVDVFTGAPAEAPAMIIQKFLDGTLDTQANTCDHDHEHGHNHEHSHEHGHNHDHNHEHGHNHHHAHHHGQNHGHDYNSEDKA